MKATMIFSTPLTAVAFAIAIISATSCSSGKQETDASGTFEATEIIVSSEATGKIISLNIQEGDELQAGKIAGLIDTTQLYLKKKQLEASINALLSKRPDTGKQIAALEQQIATQKKEKQRVENLVKANAANQKQLDDIQAGIALLEKQLIAQSSSLSITSNSINEETAALETQIEQVEDQLRKCYISNPVNGTVLVKYAQAGEVTTMGKAIYKIADTKQMILRAYLTASQLSEVKIGQNVKVLVDAGSEEMKNYEGVIEWIAAKSEFTPKTIQTKDERANLVYAIKVAVKNDGFIKIGMYGEVINN